jgi:transcriptional regulator with XRE-family HTH domain
MDRAARSTAAADASGQDPACVVGAQVRALRKARGLSLVQVAQATDLSIGYLSQIERGLSSPNLRALTALADALGVAVAALMGPLRTDAGNRGIDAVVTRAKEQPELSLWRTGIGKRRLAGGTATDGAPYSFSLMEFEPNAGAADEAYRHHGEECGMVIKGRLELTVGDRSWLLEPGDSFQFDSDRPHRFRNVARGTTQVVLVNWHRRTRPLDTQVHSA